MTNREPAILGYCIKVLAKLGATEEIQNVADMMQGLNIQDTERDDKAN